MDKTNQQVEITLLHKQVQQAWHFIDKQYSEHTKKPCFLLIVSLNSGKTSLLNNNSHIGIEAIPHLATPPENESHHNKRGNWWFNQDGIFLDLPGSYYEWFTPSSHDALWTETLNRLHHHKRFS